MIAVGFVSGVTVKKSVPILCQKCQLKKYTFEGPLKIKISTVSNMSGFLPSGTFSYTF
jgi:hypothetical protein